MPNRLPEPFDEFVSQHLPGGSSDSELDLRAYFDILRRRWWWVLGAGLLSMLGAWVYQTTQVSYPVYTAEALVQRLQQNRTIPGLAILPPTTGSIVGSELEILRTFAVLGEVADSSGLRLVVLDRPGIRTSVFGRVRVSPEAAPRDYTLQRNGSGVALLSGREEVASAQSGELLVGPGLTLEVADARVIPLEGLSLAVVSRRVAIGQLDDALRTRQVPGTDLIRISYEGSDPALAAGVANNMARAYQEQAAARARQEAERRREWIGARLASVADSLRGAQDMLLEFQAQRQTLDPESEGQSISGMLMGAQAEFRDLEEQERQLKDVTETFRTGDRDALRQVMILQGDLLPGAESLYERLQQYEERRANLVTVQRRTENSPDVRLLDSLITEMKAVMVQTAEQTLRRTRENGERAAGRVAELRSQFGDIPERSVAFGRLQQRVDRIQKMHDMLAGSLYEAQISEAVEAGDVQIIDPPVVPTLPSGVAGGGPSLLVVLLAGMLLGYGVAVGHEKLDTRIRRPEDARVASHAGVVGTIPALATNESRAAMLIGENGTPESEAFRMLRANLRFARAEELRTVGVTSPSPEDGKSMVSANLAVTLAQQGKKVLLVDCDLQRPVQHRVFGQPRSPGLTDLLIGESKTAFIRKLAGNIHLITAGTNAANPAELLGSGAFSRFLEQAREHYDMIILDTPPVLAVSDVSVIAWQLDGVLLVVRQERTHREAVRSAAGQLRRARASILGVVVNSVRLGTAYGYSGYGYGYSYGYGPEDKQKGKPSPSPSR